VASIRTQVLEGFHDPALGPERWEEVLRQGDTDVVYLTWQFQRAWWDTRGQGELLLIAAERDGQVVALAPFHHCEGVVYFGASRLESDYLDFVGDISDPEVLDALLGTARECVRDFQGFELYFVPDGSRTPRRVDEAACRLGLSCYQEWEVSAPVLDLARRPEAALAAAHKKRLLKCEEAFRRGGPLEVLHLRDGEAILPHLEEFFAQHIERWAVTPHPSMFLDPRQRKLVEGFTQAAACTGWLRFTRIDWNGRPIAFHYGTCYHGRYFWSIPTFAVDLASRSPGQVLLRQVLLAAIEEGASLFDLGIGDQEYKYRFATDVGRVRGWGLYPSTGAAARAAETGGGG
jgi:CelD/BcsL family acetyltransferase involved in cellulose biosynthesis